MNNKNSLLAGRTHCNALDDPLEGSFEDGCTLAAQIAQAPMAFILSAQEPLTFKASIGLEAEDLSHPGLLELAKATIKSNAPLILEDLEHQPFAAPQTLEVARAPIGFYLGVPLRSVQGEVLGALCVLDRRSKTLTQEQLQALKALSRQLLAQLELHEENAKILTQLCELQIEQGLRNQLVETSPLGIAIYDEDWNCVIANQALAQQIGTSRSKILASNFHNIQAVREQGLYELAQQTWTSNEPSSQVLSYRSTYGKQLWMVVHFAIIFTARGRWLVMRTEDVTELKRTERARGDLAQKLQDGLNLLNSLAQHVPGVIYQYLRYPDGRSCYPFASDRIHEMLELSPEQVREDSTEASMRIHPEDRETVQACLQRSSETLQPWKQEFRVVLPRQGLRWREGNAQPERLVDGSVLWHGYITDITERKTAETNTRQLAYYDSLTGLPNRAALLQHISEAIVLAQSTAKFGAVLFVDLDNFKRINDARGHSTGDQVLCMVGQRITGILRPTDIVARLGGDEFVVLLSNLGADLNGAGKAAFAAAERIQSVLESVYEVNGNLYNVTGSIGITFFPKSTEHTEDLLREADTAMYRAKSAGRNQIACFEENMLHEVEERLALEQALKGAIEARQLSIHVQSQVNEAGRPIGGEVLLRWTHPVYGSVSPVKFIPIAEETGLICDIGTWVLEQTCDVLSRLAALGSTLCLSVNISPKQFQQPTFVEGVLEALERTGAPARQLVLEVTEGLFIDKVETVVSRMKVLHEKGVRFSIDDFGTGYSSLSYLQKLPLHELKIDKSFVKAVPWDTQGTAIVNSIISVAKHLKLNVVAEGVENLEQVGYLRGAGCDSCQGFYFAKPQPVESWVFMMEMEQAGCVEGSSARASHTGHEDSPPRRAALRAV